MKRIVMLGWYGHGNFGNMMIGAGIEKSFKNHRSVECEFYSIKKKGKIIHKDAYCNGEVDLSSSSGTDFLSEFDGVVFGGGLFTSLFGDYWEDFSLLEKTLKSIKKPLALHCVGSGDGSQIKRKFDNAKINEIQERILPLFKYISVRDEITRSLFHLPDEKVFPDPAFYLQPNKPSQISKEIIVIPTTRAYLKSIDDQLLSLNSTIRAGSHKPIYLPFQTLDNQDFNDLRLSQNVCSHNPIEIQIPNYKGISDVLDRISQSSGVVSFRLHGTIAGLVCGKNTTSIAYDPKIDPVLEAAGFSPTILNINSFTGKESSPLNYSMHLTEDHALALRLKIEKNARLCLDALI